jgi:hypothetical protein
MRGRTVSVTAAITPTDELGRLADGPQRGPTVGSQAVAIGRFLARHLLTTPRAP